VKKSNMVTLTKSLLYSSLALMLVGSIVNCGGGSSTGPVQAEAPKALIQDFVAKHDTMVDSSLVNFYVAEEQPMVAVAVERAIEEKKASGELEKLQQASFDFTNMKIAVVGEKEVFVHDEPTKVIKVSVTGSYSMTHENNTATIPADKTIILEMVNNQWKVTEKVNPWKEYKYKTRG
jgi:hypothetical protein